MLVDMGVLSNKRITIVTVVQVVPVVVVLTFQVLQFLLLLLPLHHPPRVESEARDRLEPYPFCHFEQVVGELRLAVLQEPLGRSCLLKLVDEVSLGPS